jgi:hypothetical protein
LNTFASPSAENLTKEAKHDTGMADHHSAQWAMNCIYFQLAMLAYKRTHSWSGWSRIWKAWPELLHNAADLMSQIR